MVFEYIWIILHKTNLFFSLFARLCANLPLFLAISEKQKKVVKTYMQIKNKQSRFKKIFFYHFLKLRNVQEAGIKAGLTKESAFEEGMKI